MNFHGRAQTRPSTNPKSQSMINERLFAQVCGVVGRSDSASPVFANKKHKN